MTEVCVRQGFWVGFSLGFLLGLGIIVIHMFDVERCVARGGQLGLTCHIPPKE